MLKPAYQYKAYVLKVIDGDTLDLEVDLGFNVRVRERVRLLGVDTPETYGVSRDSQEYRAGMAAKQFVEMKLGQIVHNDYIIVETDKDRKGKYGRYLAKIWYCEDIGQGLWRCINDVLLEEGLARKY